MTPHQYRTALEKLALTQVGAARLFAVQSRTSRNWAQIGGNGPPKAVAIVLRAWLAGKISLDDVSGQ